MAYHYSVPPPGYVPYDYSTSTSSSPGPEKAYEYYVPQYHTPISSKKAHARGNSYAAPRLGGWHSPTGYPSPSYYATVPTYNSPPVAKYEYVSTTSFHAKPQARRYSTSGPGNGSNRPEAGHRRQASRSQNQHIYVDAAVEAKDQVYDSSAEEPMYSYIAPRASHRASTKKTTPKADNYFFFSQTPSYEPDTPVRSRARRPSTNGRPKSSSKSTKPAPVATAEDALRHRIPAGYSLKNWDPTEEPILLLGSVFDANSLGKWIYDWTVYHHKAGSPLTEVAGELWLLLIKFAGKMKRAEECLPRIRGRDNRGMVRDFYESGERIWAKMKSLLKLCEEFMWMVAKKEGAKGKIQMGEKSGIEFVKSIFGRERELERTEKLMTSMRLWNMRFDANCEAILRRPSAS